MGGDGRVKILVVDDQAAQRMALTAALGELDEEVITVGSGAEALRLLLESDVAVILLDVNMPDMDGFETAGLIRQRPRTRHTPIIFLTADTDEMLLPRAYALGAVDFILNPFLPLARLRKPQVVLIDLGLPGVDGLEVASRIRSTPDGAGMLLIAVTGYGQTLDRQRTREAGFDLHVVKPVDPETLGNVLALAVQRFALRAVVRPTPPRNDARLDKRA